jgi:hypothetical protein
VVVTGTVVAVGGAATEVEGAEGGPTVVGVVRGGAVGRRAVDRWLWQLAASTVKMHPATATVARAVLLTSSLPVAGASGLCEWQSGGCPCWQCS